MESKIIAVFTLVSFICFKNIYSICSPDVTGQGCVKNISETLNETTSSTVTEEPIVSTLRPFSQRTCLFGMLICENGYCRNRMQCVCDTHWTGAKCEKLNCPLICEGLCEIKDNELACSTLTSTIQATESTTGKVASITEASDALNNSTATGFKPQKPLKSSDIEISLRDIRERTCNPDYVCVHGYCNVQNLSCICDKNWMGSNCSILDCPAECINNCEVVNYNIACLKSQKEMAMALSDPAVSPTESKEEITTTASTTEDTKWSLKERTCMQNFFVCVNGFCKREAVRFWCECDENWTGTFCDKINCPHCEGGCTLSNSTIVCNVISDISTNKSTTVLTTTVEPFNETYPDGHVCSLNYTKRSQTCIIPCIYGKCQLLGKTSFKCVCDRGADGQMCEKKCCRNCGENGLCRIDINGTEFCNCEYDYEGEYCETKIVPKELEEETWYWWVVGVCLGLIVILVFALVVLPYWMWRNRVILIMKIVHYFQRYEDNDEREWDAFISYKCDDRDESFVLRQLYSKLEVEMGFKLCLHFRDFIPGDTIANNIIRAVQGSRRTILLLTPRYVQSEFTKFEYQMAQTEMLKRRHRIIPLVLEDINPVKGDLDPNLEQIIHSVTYLEWPGNEDSLKIQKFWKKLVLSMPKKKEVEERLKALSSSSSSTSYTFSSQISEIPLVTHSVSVDSSSSNRVSMISSDTNTTDYIPTGPVKNNEIILKLSEESYDANSNERKPSNLNSNIHNYLDLIDPGSVTC